MSEKKSSVDSCTPLLRGRGVTNIQQTPHKMTNEVLMCHGQLGEGGRRFPGGRRDLRTVPARKRTDIKYNTGRRQSELEARHSKNEETYQIQTAGHGAFP